MGRGTLGCPGSQSWVSTTLCLPFSFVANASSPSELLPQFHPGVSSHCFCERLANEGYHRTGILGTRFLQPFICYSKGHGRLEACHRSFSPHSLCLPFSFSYGNHPVGPPFPAPWGLDDLHRPSGCIPPGSCLVPLVLSWSPDIPVSGSFFGLSTAPQVFTRVTAPVSFIIHRFGYRILRYLDGRLFLVSSFQEITRAKDFLL